MPKDRRIFQRIEGIVNIRYTVKGRDKKKIECLPRNIGGGGAGICLTEKLQPGTLLELEITVPDDPYKTITGRGEVLWIKPFGAIKSDKNVDLYESGIKFIDIAPLAVGRVYTYYNQAKHSLSLT